MTLGGLGVLNAFFDFIVLTSHGVASISVLISKNW